MGFSRNFPRLFRDFPGFVIPSEMELMLHVEHPVTPTTKSKSIKLVQAPLPHKSKSIKSDRSKTDAHLAKWLPILAKLRATTLRALKPKSGSENRWVGGSYTELKHICTYMYIFICIFRRRSNRSPVPSCLQFGTFGRDPNSRDLFQLLQLLQTAVRVASVSLCSYTAKKCADLQSVFWWMY